MTLALLTKSGLYTHDPVNERYGDVTPIEQTPRFRRSLHRKFCAGTLSGDSGGTDVMTINDRRELDARDRSRVRVTPGQCDVTVVTAS
ncbi:MAG: hypothetical protein WCC22_06655 [Terriglobales bacterium]